MTNIPDEKEQPLIVKAGEDFHLAFGADHIIYAGMVSDEVYSIVQKKSSGHQGYAWNLYFPKSRREITIDGVNLNVERRTKSHSARRKTSA
jgi:hypothetical protein